MLADKLDAGVTVKVLSELEAIGALENLTHVVKPSEDNCIVPLHVVLE